jgi:hemolysin III
LQYAQFEERLNTVSHGVGFLLAIAGLILLVLKAHSTVAIASVTVYGGSLVLMFLASTLYHGSTDTTARQWLKMVDHSAIYLLIAGTYTPFMLITLDNWIGMVGAIVIWSLALAGLIFKWVVKHRVPRLSLALYLLMGWLVVVLIYPLYQALSVGGLLLLLAGGICYSVGAFFYAAKHRQYTHFIWHLFVIAGAACHYFAIYLYVLN